MSRDSNTHTVSIVSTPTTALAQAAASMAAGTWLQFKAFNANQNSALGLGAITGSMLPYCNAMPWNPIQKRIEVLARDHQDPPNDAGIRYSSYHESNDPDPVNGGAADTWVHYRRYSNIQRGHGNDHLEVNPYTGDLYHKTNDSYPEVQTPYTVMQTPSGTTFNVLPNLPVGIGNVTHATCWWDGPFTGATLGVQGGFLVYMAYQYGAPTNGNLLMYDPTTGTWPFQRNGASPNLINVGGVDGMYNQVMAYSRVKNCAVYGGCNQNKQRPFRLSSDGTVTELTTMPSVIGDYGLQCGFGIHSGHLCADPITGNFLVLTRGRLFELNPTGAGTWTQMPNPPAGPGWSANTEYGQGNCVFVTELWQHGVICVVRQSNQNNSAMWLYRHA